MSEAKRYAPDLSVAQVAELLGVHRGTVRRLVRLGRLPAYRVSVRGHWRFRREYVVRFRDATAGAERRASE